MKVPGFTAEAAIDMKGSGNFGVQPAPPKRPQSGITAALISPIHRIPFPGPIDICNARISDCIHRGGNAFSWRNLCSFVCS